MNADILRRAAWWSMVGVLVAGVAAQYVLGGSLENPEVMVPIVMYALVGAVIASHRPENPIGWVFLGVGAGAGLSALGDAAATAALAQGGPVPWWGVAGAWVNAWIWFPMLSLMTFFTALLYPKGLPSRRWRPVLWLSVMGLVVITVLAALNPTLCLGPSDDACAGGVLVANPISPAFMAGVGDVEDLALFAVFGLIVLLGLLTAFVSAFVRTFRSTGVESLQMRWFAFAVCLLLVDLALEPYLPGGEDGLLATVTFAVALTAVPLSCGLAIMRYRLYEIDRIISRTIAYSLVTAALLLTYFAVVTSVTRLLPQQSSSFAVAGATLAAAALFRPLLTRFQRLVDHRFNRTRYDAERTVEGFAADLRDETDETAILGRLTQALDVTMQPATAVVWLRSGTS